MNTLRCRSPLLLLLRSCLLLPLSLATQPAWADCSDGFVDLGEACDDGNSVNGDGCDSACSVEGGYDCARSGPYLDIDASGEWSPGDQDLNGQSTQELAGEFFFDLVDTGAQLRLDFLTVDDAVVILVADEIVYESGVLHPPAQPFSEGNLVRPWDVHDQGLPRLSVTLGSNGLEFQGTLTTNSEIIDLHPSAGGPWSLPSFLIGQNLIGYRVENLGAGGQGVSLRVRGSGGACATSCGDGVPAGSEGCDDGDADDANECSNQCLINVGFEGCSELGDCEQGATACLGGMCRVGVGIEEACGSLETYCVDEGAVCFEGECLFEERAGPCDEATQCLPLLVCGDSLCRQPPEETEPEDPVEEPDDPVEEPDDPIEEPDDPVERDDEEPDEPGSPPDEVDETQEDPEQVPEPSIDEDPESNEDEPPPYGGGGLACSWNPSGPLPQGLAFAWVVLLLGMGRRRRRPQ